MRLNNKHFASLTHWTGLVMFIVLISLHLIECTSTSRHRVLSFFFDGVPPLEKVKSETDTSFSDKEQTLEELASIDSSSKGQQTVYYHPQIDNSQCGTCHDVTQSYVLIADPESLCLTCHDDKTEADYVHPPVEEGSCTECHNPHGSENKYLLKLTGQSLCSECHDIEDVKALETHEGIGDEACYECHDPHGGDNEYFIR